MYLTVIYRYIDILELSAINARYYSLGNLTLIKMDLWLPIQLVNEKKSLSRYLATAEFRVSPHTFLATIYCLISETF